MLINISEASIYASPGSGIAYREPSGLEGKRLKTDYSPAISLVIVGFSRFRHVADCFGDFIPLLSCHPRVGRQQLYSSVDKMLEALGNSDDLIEVFRDDSRITIAVLYYHVILVDGRLRETELEHYRQILSDSLQVTEDELLLFEKKVLEHIGRKKSFENHLSKLRLLPLSKRKEILAHMQELSVSDNELHEFEINLVSYSRKLLGLDEENADQDLSVKPS